MQNNFYQHFIEHYFLSLRSKYDDNFNFDCIGGLALHNVATRRLEIEKALAIIAEQTKQNFVCINESTFFDQNIEQFEYLYNHLVDDESKHRFIEILCYKILGFTKVKLSKPELYMYEKINELEQFSNPDDFIVLDNFPLNLTKFNLRLDAGEINLYFSKYGIYINFIMEQYNYKSIVEVLPGDIVVDCGACWGDTALYFAFKGAKRIYSFEFIESQCKIFNMNVSMNPKYRERIELVKLPLWEKSDIELSYHDNGPGSRVGEKNLYPNKVKTICLDDFAREQNIEKIDFIKMDIEGAELSALRGAEGAIRRHKPKLAICVYHKNDDMIEIPRYLMSINPSYKFYFDYYTNLGWEYVLYAVSEAGDA